MSGTALEIELRLAEELRRLADSGPMTHRKTEQMAKHLADAIEIACDRIRQLERGIEKANERAIGFGDVDGSRLWHDNEQLMSCENATLYTSLMQLIEELGNEH